MTPFTADQKAAITKMLAHAAPVGDETLLEIGRKHQHEVLCNALGKLMTPALQYDEFGPCAPGDEEIDTSDISEAGKEFFERATLREPERRTARATLHEPERRTARERLPNQIIDAINSLVTAQIRGRVGTNMTTRMSAMRELEQAETRLRGLLREVIRAC